MKPYQQLTARQKEVVAQVVMGKTNAQIALELFVDEKCIKFHLTRIFKILDFKSRAELIVSHYQRLLFQDARGRLK